MSKPVDDKGKTELKPQEEASAASPVTAETQPESAAPAPDTLATGKPIGAYSPETTRPLITRKAYEEIDHNRPWMDDPKSRLAIRMFSRGVLGAAFFTAGGMLAKRWMNQLEHTPGVIAHQGYDATKSLAHQENPLQFIAKLIDTTVGKPIEAAVTAISGSKAAGEAAVRFRDTNWTRGKQWGRSLGEEVVMITFDFFCASVGDAIGRDIAGWFDPNVKKTWMDDKGNIKIPEATKQLAERFTRYVTYNGGEDWAVAIPYAYFMKGQRALINRHSPGFQYDFDRSMNGGAFKLGDRLNASGQKEYHVKGNYNFEGIMDLQSRFTVYNIGTLMFREAYDYIVNKTSGKPDSLYGAPDKVQEPKSILGSAGDLLKWVARSIVKGTIIMTPAVPFFSVTRTPQTKHRGSFIHSEEGQLTHIINSDTGRRDAVLANNIHDGIIPLSESLTLSKYVPELHNGHNGAPYTRKDVTGQVLPVMQGERFKPYGQTFGAFDSVVNKAGEINYHFANTLDRPAAFADRNWGETGATIKRGLSIPVNNNIDKVQKFERFTRPMLYAAASYTPYMYAKAEFAQLWDNGKMDMAAERMIDGATSFNWGEFKAGAGEVWNAILHKPMDDPAREVEAQHRNKVDTSAADIFTKTQSQVEEEKKKFLASQVKPNKELTWEERMHTAKSPVPEKKHSGGASLEDTYKIASHAALARSERKPELLAEREKMRKVLEEVKPPTNSIN